jgi:O-antigen ligase
LEKAAFTIYLVTLIISPLLFGSVHTYAYTLMALGIFTGTLLLVIKNVRKDLKTGTYRLHLPNTSLNLFFLIMTGFLIIQVIPLPDCIVKMLSTEAWVVQQKSDPASSIAIGQGQGNIWASLSPYYYPVRMSIIRFTVYGLFFFGLIQVLNSQKRIELAIFLILTVGCFEAIYGLAQTFSGSEHVWWFKKTRYLGDVTGTYGNRNHFAGLMEMCLLLAAGYAAGLSERIRKRKLLSKPKSSLRARLSKYFSGEQRFNKRVLVLFAGVVIGVGLFFSASRGGMLATAGGMLCMSLLFIFSKAHRRNGVVVLLLFLIIAVYCLHIGAEYPIGRFEHLNESFEARSRWAKTTLDLLEDYKLTGIGVGNFRYGYPKYQAVEDRRYYMRHTSNDWAQFLAEAGLIGFCLLLGLMTYYVLRTMRLWNMRRDTLAIGLGAAPLAAMAAMAIHSYSDFNLHYPADFLMFVAIIAIGYSALHLERHRGRDRTIYRYYDIPLKYKGFLALILVSGFIAWSGIWSIRHFIAECYCNTVHNYSLNRDPNPPLEELGKAISWDRYNAEYWYKLARELMRVRHTEALKPDRDIEARCNHRMEVIKALEQAVRLNPFKAEYHMRLGWAYVYLWRLLDHQQKWLSAADMSIDRATYFAGDINPSLHVHLANYWIMRSKTINPAKPEWGNAWARACWHYKKAQGMDGTRQQAEQIVRFVWEYYPDEVFIRKVLSDKHHVLLKALK